VTAPAWLAARNGLVSSAQVNKSAQVNQLALPHQIAVSEAASSLIFWPAMNGGPPLTTADPVVFGWDSLLATVYAVNIPAGSSTITEVLQKVGLPLRAVGRGADVRVTVVGDDGTGNPSTTPLAGTQPMIIPADMITLLGSSDGTMSGPLQVPQNHRLVFSLLGLEPYNGPLVGVAGQLNGASLCSGNYIVMAGGSDSTLTSINTVWLMPWIGNNQLARPISANPLPIALESIAFQATTDSLIVAGGVTRKNGTGIPASSSVFLASWSPTSGQIGSWTTQPSLPQGIYTADAAFDPASSTVYIVGGANSGGTYLNTVYYSTLTNGQLSAWKTATMPQRLSYPIVGVVDGWLVVAGGELDTLEDCSAETYYAKINADGSLQGWNSGPTLFEAAATKNYAFLDHAIVAVGSVDPSGEYLVQTLTFGPTGPGQFTGNWESWSNVVSWTGQLGVFQTDTNHWEGFLVSQNEYLKIALDWVPFPFGAITQPITFPAHTDSWVLIEQVGGDDANYVEIGRYTSSAASPVTWTKPVAGGAWTQNAGMAVPMANNGYVIGDGSPYGDFRTPPMMLTSDDGQRVTWMVNATSPDQRLLGLIESTQQNDGTWMTGAVATGYDTTGSKLVSVSTIDLESPA
jgi:hypothetical protein